MHLYAWPLLHIFESNNCPIWWTTPFTVHDWSRLDLPIYLAYVHQLHSMAWIISPSHSLPPSSPDKFRFGRYFGHCPHLPLPAIPPNLRVIDTPWHHLKLLIRRTSTLWNLARAWCPAGHTAGHHHVRDKPTFIGDKYQAHDSMREIWNQ